MNYMTNKHDIFISYKRKSLPTANRWICSNVVLASLTFFTLDNVQASLHCTRLFEKFHRASYGVPLVLLWLFYGAYFLHFNAKNKNILLTS